MDSLTARVLAFALPALGIVVSGQHVTQQTLAEAEPPAQVAMLESPQVTRLAEVESQLDTAELASAQPSRCLLYTSPSPRDQRGSRMPSSA